MIDINLVRWINASVNKAFVDGKGSYILYIEGQELVFKNPDGSDAESWAELHFSVGPEIDEVTAGCYEIDLTLTIMCTATFTDDDYLLHRITGQFLGIMSADIRVLRYGDGNAYIGCLQPKNKAIVQPWGPVQQDKGPLRVKQQSVEQQFHMSI